MFSKTLSLDIERAYNVLISETNPKFSKRQEERGQDNFQNTTDNINLY